MAKILKVSCPFCGWPSKIESFHELHPLRIRILRFGGRHGGGRGRGSGAICEWVDFESPDLKTTLRQQIVIQLQRVASSLGYRLQEILLPISLDFVKSRTIEVIPLLEVIRQIG